jgi:hypothetical protein
MESPANVNNLRGAQGGVQGVREEARYEVQPAEQ